MTIIQTNARGLACLAIVATTACGGPEAGSSDADEVGTALAAPPCVACATSDAFRRDRRVAQFAVATEGQPGYVVPTDSWQLDGTAVAWTEGVDGPCVPGTCTQALSVSLEFGDLPAARYELLLRGRRVGADADVFGTLGLPFGCKFESTRYTRCRGTIEHAGGPFHVLLIDKPGNAGDTVASSLEIDFAAMFTP